MYHLFLDDCMTKLLHAYDIVIVALTFTFDFTIVVAYQIWHVPCQIFNFIILKIRNLLILRFLELVCK